MEDFMDLVLYLMHGLDVDRKQTANALSAKLQKSTDQHKFIAEY